MKALSASLLSLSFVIPALALGCGSSKRAGSLDGSVSAQDGAPEAADRIAGTGGSSGTSTGGTGIITPGTGGSGEGTGGRAAGTGGGPGTGGATAGTGGSTATVDAGTGIVTDAALVDGGGDGGTSIGADGGGDGPITKPCPTSPPENGDPCDRGLDCYYEDCADAGRTVATCAQSAWSVSVSPCNTYTCQSGIVSTTCPAGMVCVAIASGFPVAQCLPNDCGSGPISCDCLASCVGACAVRGTAETGVTIDCNPCPLGGCV